MESSTETNKKAKVVRERELLFFFFFFQRRHQRNCGVSLDQVKDNGERRTWQAEWSVFFFF